MVTTAAFLVGRIKPLKAYVLKGIRTERVAEAELEYFGPYPFHKGRKTIQSRFVDTEVLVSGTVLWCVRVLPAPAQKT